MSEEKLSRAVRLDKVVAAYPPLMARLATLPVAVAYENYANTSLSQMVQSFYEKVVAEKFSSYATRSIGEFETDLEKITAHVEEATSKSWDHFQPVAKFLLIHTKSPLIIQHETPLSITASLFGSIFTATSIGDMQKQVEQLVKIEQQKHQEALVDYTTVWEDYTTTLAFLSALEPDNTVLRDIRMNVFALEAENAKLGSDVYAQPVVEQAYNVRKLKKVFTQNKHYADKLKNRSVPGGRSTAGQSVKISGTNITIPSQYLLPLTTGFALFGLVVALVIVLPVVIAAIITGALTATAFGSVVYNLQKSARELDAKTTLMVSKASSLKAIESAEAPWNENAARMLTNRLTVWRRAFATHPQFDTELSSLVASLEALLATEHTSKLQEPIRGDLERFCTDHLPEAIDAFVRLELTQDEVKEDALSIFKETLSGLKERALYLAKISEESALSDLKTSNNFIKSFSAGDLDLS